MPVIKSEKLFCGMCGATLEYGAAFKSHPRTRSCPGYETLNPVYFHFCFRCGIRLIIPAEQEEEEIYAS